MKFVSNFKILNRTANTCIKISSIKNFINLNKFKASGNNNIIYLNRKQNIIRYYNSFKFSENNKSPNNKDSLESIKDIKEEDNLILNAEVVNTDSYNKENISYPINIYKTDYNYNKQKMLSFTHFILSPLFIYFTFKSNYSIIIKIITGFLSIAPTMTVIHNLLGSYVFVKEINLISNDTLEIISIKNLKYYTTVNCIYRLMTQRKANITNTSPTGFVSSNYRKLFIMSNIHEYKDEEIFDLIFNSIKTNVLFNYDELISKNGNKETNKQNVFSEEIIVSSENTKNTKNKDI